MLCINTTCTADGDNSLDSDSCGGVWVWVGGVGGGGGGGVTGADEPTILPHSYSPVTELVGYSQCDSRKWVFALIAAYLC